MSQNAALEAQLISQQNITQGLAELPGAITTVLSRSQARMRRMLVDPKGSGKPSVFPGREEDFYVWTKKVENYVSGVFPNVCGALVGVLQLSHKTWSQQQQLRLVCQNSELRRLQREMYSSSWCCQPSPKVKASTLSCQQEVTMASRVGASCTEGGTRTQRDEHEVS